MLIIPARINWIRTWCCLWWERITNRHPWRKSSPNWVTILYPALQVVASNALIQVAAVVPSFWFSPYPAGSSSIASWKASIQTKSIDCCLSHFCKVWQNWHIHARYPVRYQYKCVPTLAGYQIQRSYRIVKRLISLKSSWIGWEWAKRDTNL